MTKFEDYFDIYKKISSDEDRLNSSMNPQIIHHFPNDIAISMPTSVRNKIQQFHRFALVINDKAEKEYSEENFLECEEDLWSIFWATNGDVAERLAILYRKQHRFSDEVNVLKLAIKIGNDNTKIKARLEKSLAYYDKHKSIDKSL